MSYGIDYFNPNGEMLMAIHHEHTDLAYDLDDFITLVERHGGRDSDYFPGLQIGRMTQHEIRALIHFHRVRFLQERGHLPIWYSIGGVLHDPVTRRPFDGVIGVVGGE